MLKNNLKIVADENIPGLAAMFSGDVVLKQVAGRQMSASDVADADLLLVRSITQVDAALLDTAKHLKMVGTATIGTDHLDKDYLTGRSIPFFNAPGCNADAVVEYDLAVLFNLFEERGESLVDKTVGVVGVGNVGGRLCRRLEALGMKVLKNDPPRQAAGESGFIALDEVFAQADVICLHTPLVKTGQWPSYHLVGDAELERLKLGAVLLNAGRGPVIDNQALLGFLQQRTDVTAILDVWEHEPQVDATLAARVHIATPHIAGYSLDGKLRGTHMLRQAAATVLDAPQPPDLSEFLPVAAVNAVTVSDDITISALINMVYDPLYDDRRMRKTLTCDDQPVRFDLLRKQYPVRREFASLRVSGLRDQALREQLRAIGFSIDLA